MQAKLVVVSGKTTKRVVPLNLPTVLGRSRAAALTVAHPIISRRHCEIFEQDGLIFVRDMESLNGTMIGGRRIKLAPLLPNGEFTIGPLTFRVLYEHVGDVVAVPEIEYADASADVPADGPALPETEEFEADFESEAESPAPEPDAVNMSDFLAWADVDSADDAAAASADRGKVEPVPAEIAEPDEPAPSPPPNAAEIATRRAAVSRQAAAAQPPAAESPQPPPAAPNPVPMPVPQTAPPAGLGPWSDPTSSAELNWATFQKMYQESVAPGAAPAAPVQPPAAPVQPPAAPVQPPAAPARPAVAKQAPAPEPIAEPSAEEGPAEAAAEEPPEEPAGDIDDFLSGLQ